MIAVISKGLRRQLCVVAVSGIAVTMEPIAYSVTNWPIRDSDTRRSALICGSKPARGSRPEEGEDGAAAASASPSAVVAEVEVMEVAIKRINRKSKKWRTSCAACRQDRLIWHCGQLGYSSK